MRIDHKCKNDKAVAFGTHIDREKATRALHPFDSYRLKRFEPLQHYESRFYLGYALSMLLSFRISSCLTVCVLALAIAALSHEAAYAQIPAAPVETYVDDAVPAQPGEGVLPEGVTWNKPLKAGDMVLPRLTKPKPKANPVFVPKAVGAVIGEPKAPQIGASSKTAKAPQITKDGSTQSMMMLQGLKSALNQGGQNPDLPKSDLVPVDAMDAKAKAAAQEKMLPSLADSKAAAVPLRNADDSFINGQEPKGWVPPGGKVPSAAQTAAKPAVDDGMMDITFPPEMTNESASAAAVDAPKATDIAEQPVALEHAPTKKASEPGFMDRLSKPFASIFGSPVEDKKTEETSAPTTAGKKTVDASGKCEPSVSKWTRECGDAGYPPHFVGQIVGETRVECPAGEAKDVWLSNNCAAPIASSSYAVQDKRAAGAPAVASSAALGASPNAAVIVPNAEASVDAACGVANGLASDGKPAGDLCAQGEASPVSGDGPWRWSCKGGHGGMTVSCAAPVASGKDIKKNAKASSSTQQEIAVEDGKCGDSAGAGAESAPSGGLCAKGTPSLVNGNGPWTWACSGVNGGSAAACTAPKKIAGACGPANDTGVDSMPMRDLCTAGYASAVTGTGPWNWSCSGLHGGPAATCTASAKINAVCGAASLTGSREAPSDALCNVGTASRVSGLGPWSWTCEGTRGGASVTCKAPVMGDGSCGLANGNQYDKAPTEGLCTDGTPTRVTGLGPWNWNCSGTNGGATASCTASLGSKEDVAAAVSCGESSESLVLAKPSEKLCASGTASSVTGEGPWNWTCADKAGHSVSCSTLVAKEGGCGKAANVVTRTAPTRDLCIAGTASEVVAFEKKAWKWECQGSLGAASTTCTAPMAGGVAGGKLPEAKETTEKPVLPEAQCGSVAGQSLSSKPVTNLCEAGKASAVKGTGPWSWTCGTKTKVNCEALLIAEGKCGGANGSVQRSAPTSGLCAAGSATEITGTGPWMWSCVGSGGGASTSCSATAQSQTKVDGSCGAAGNAVVAEAPATNLCDSGMPSAVYGDGPWTWTCSGMNGGIASTCNTSKVVPKAPPPPGPAVNGVCGPANGVASSETPERDVLCSGGTPTGTSGHGPWNWGCIGANGGMTVSCTAPLTPPAPIVGACGSANGTPTLTIPKSGLCSSGIMSAVSGKGPWTWSCSGTNGGGAVSCVAPLAGPNASSHGMPSVTTPSIDSGEAPTPRAAPVGLVTPQLPTGALAPMKPGTLPALKLSKKGAPVAPEASTMPTAKIMDNGYEAPPAIPELPEGMQPVNPPPVRDTTKPLAGVKPPVLDSEGKPVPGARLVLDSDVSTISFSRGADQLDRDAVEIVEQLARILAAHGNARITLVAYSDTDGAISPREARRISLNRALAIRDFLAAKGISSGRVDVRPMGANVPSGDMDRVDVKVN